LLTISELNSGRIKLNLQVVALRIVVDKAMAKSESGQGTRIYFDAPQQRRASRAVAVSRHF
jgi:5'(3')-deoxyribonucleotidase